MCSVFDLLLDSITQRHLDLKKVPKDIYTYRLGGSEERSVD